MIRTGKVVGGGSGTLEVCFERPEMCAQCGACAGHKIHEETVKIKGDAAIGDIVTVNMPDGKIVKVSLIAYIIPLIGLMIGLLIGQAAFSSDLWAALFGLLGLGAGILVTRAVDRKFGLRPEWQPQLVSVAHPQPSTNQKEEQP